MIAREGPRMPALSRVASVLGGSVSVTPVPIPLDCVDGFIEAYYGAAGGVPRPGGSCGAVGVGARFAG